MWQGLKTGYLVIAICLASCGPSAGLGDFQPGEQGRVVRVMDGDALVLDTGQSVRLVGIEAPAFGRDGRPDAPHAEASRRMLEDLVLGRQVQLHYAGLTRDRYDRALAHVATTDRLGADYWVNLELVARGAARVRTYPDTSLGSKALFDAETEARAKARGVWALAAYKPRDARDFGGVEPGFVILMGILGPRRAPIFDETACARDLMGSDITVIVDLSAMDACDFEAGLRVEVRAWYSDGRLSLNSADNLRAKPAPAMAEAYSR